MAFIDVTKTKVCFKCGNEKKVTEFYYQRKTENFSAMCRVCNQERCRAIVKKPRTKEDAAKYKVMAEAKEQARSLGYELEMFAKNGQAMRTGDNYGGYMIVTQGTRNIIAGLKYSMTAEEVLSFCKEEVEARSTAVN